MKKLFCKSMIFSFFIIFMTTNVAWAKKLDIQTLNRLIERTRKRWVAAETSKSKLSMKDQQLLCRLKMRQLTRNKLQGKRKQSTDYKYGVIDPILGDDYNNFLPHYKLIATDSSIFGFITEDGFHSQLRIYERI